MPRLVRRVEAIPQRRAKLYGEKARNLARLSRGGFAVPAAFALPAAVCEEALSPLIHRLMPGRTSLGDLFSAPPPSAKELGLLANEVLKVELSHRLRQELVDVFSELTERGARALAVRSSSTAEDLDEASAAGLHKTVLNVQTREGLEDAVRACWASLVRPTAMSYLAQVGAQGAQMGIVIQAMVPAQVSGIMFTSNPLTGDPGEIVVNAAYGLGALLVDGKVSPDTVRIDKRTRTIRDRVVGDKATKLVEGAEGTQVVDVPLEDRQRFCIDEETALALGRTGARIEELFGCPQDIEWAVLNGRTFILQSRPISGASSMPQAPSGSHLSKRDEIVWSNANVGEALPGVATPLTWSVLSDFSEFGFRQAFTSMGCKTPKGAELVGNFRGRIYLNLTEAMSILSQVPGLSPALLLSLGGGGELRTLESVVEKRSSRGFFLRLPFTASRLFREQYHLASRVEAFEEMFADERARIAGADLRILSPQALGKTLRSARGLLDEAGSVLLNCYGNFLASMVALRTMLNWVAGENRTRLEHDLLSGLCDVESAAPGLRLWHIAEMASQDPAARDMITQVAPSQLQLADLPEGPIQRALHGFLTAYGHRGPREAELMEPRWREDPTLIFVALRAQMNGDVREVPVDIERRQRAVRDRAIKELESRLPIVGHVAARHLLTLVARFARLRERLRSHVTEVLGMFRLVALDASRRLVAKNPEYGTDAAFFLTLTELYRFLLSDEQPKVSLVRRRRRQFLRDQQLPAPPGTFVGFPPENEPEVATGNTLVGLPASGGIAEGRARVLHSPSDAEKLRAGEILVAPSADVGWTPLFTIAGAVVTDLGGPLSHASVVAREFGLPAVVNLKNGTRRIKTGDRLSVNGDTGHVRFLDET